MNAPRQDIVVIQAGARQDYLVARMLQANGRLAGLVTDFCVPEGAESAITRMIGNRWPKEVARRTVRGIPAAFVFDSLLITIASRLADRFVPGISSFVEDVGLGWGARRCPRDIRAVYSVYGGGESYLRDAKKRGIRIVSDVIITPLAHRIEAEERARFRGWENESIPPWLHGRLDRKTERMLELSDLLLCPSQTVLDGLNAFPGFDPERAVMLPYMSRYRSPAPSFPKPGRVLFAGTACLRKGIPYLAKAAEIAKAHDKDIEFVVAGPAADSIRTRPEVSALTFLGKLDSTALAREYARADIFTLPSLAEGSAYVVYEALAFGLPVVTTPATGSIVVDDIEGRIVPERDPQKLAEAILSIVRDRALRDRYSDAARAAHQNQDFDNWAERLVALIDS